MNKRRRQKPQRRNRSKRGFNHAVESGFDFGTKIHVLFVSDVSFVDLLKQAEIVACVYRYSSYGPLKVPMREIRLVGRNADPLFKAFTEFNRWSNSTDGDAVELIFIFLKDGGYLLSIGRESKRVTRDFRGSDRACFPMLISENYIKKFDTRHPAVEELREYKQKFLISPFLFGAAALRVGSGGFPVLEDIQPLQNLDSLLKFEAEFVSEEAIKPGSTHYSLLTASQHPKLIKRGKRESIPWASDPKRPSPAEYFRHRMAILERHFPVTIERIRSGRSSEMMRTLNAQGVRNWQFEQAICNLLLSSALCNGQKFYSTVANEDLSVKIAQALKEREEKSDTPDLNQFSTNEILIQVRLDTLHLLGAAGHHPSSGSTLNGLQKELAARNLLDPENG